MKYLIDKNYQKICDSIWHRKISQLHEKNHRALTSIWCWCEKNNGVHLKVINFKNFNFSKTSKFCQKENPPCAGFDLIMGFVSRMQKTSTPKNPGPRNSTHYNNGFLRKFLLKTSGHYTWSQRWTVNQVTAGRARRADADMMKSYKIMIMKIIRN